jgi:hypothetical protein
MQGPPLVIGGKRATAFIAAVAIVSLAVAPPLSAQSREDHRRHATFTAGASLGDGGSALALSAGVGVRWSSLGVEVEIAYARKLDFTLDVCPPPRLCVIGGQIPVTGRTLALVPQLSIQLLPASRRVRVYLQAGVGAGHVRQRYFLGPPFAGTVTERTRSNVTLAVASGGGLTIQISRRMALASDVRALHLLDAAASPEQFIVPSGTLTTLRLGSRVSWQF